MWWKCDDDDTLVNLDNVETVRVFYPDKDDFMASDDKPTLGFWMAGQGCHDVEFDTVNDARRELNAIYNALRHEDEQRHGAAHHCSVCTERCEGGEK